MNTHKFDVEDAEKHGIEKAILLEHLKFHQEANQGNDDLEFEGKTYAFIKPETIKKMYPYLSYKSVLRWLSELEEDGIIKSMKPHAKQGNHLKYYHVVGHSVPNSQNEKSNSQKREILNSQNESSSILPNEEPNVVERLEHADSKKQLLSIWKDYRKKKGKHMSLYEEDVLINATWKNKSVTDIKESILYTIENGWFSLQERESESKEFNPKIAKMRKNAFK